MEWRPRLRPDVERVGEDELSDRPLGRRVRLGKISRALAGRLDGSRDLRALVDEAAADSGAERAEVEDALRMFLLLDLVEGAGAGHVERARALAAGAPTPTPEVLAGAASAASARGSAVTSTGPVP